MMSRYLDHDSTDRLGELLSRDAYPCWWTLPQIVDKEQALEISENVKVKGTRVVQKNPCKTQEPGKQSVPHCLGGDANEINVSQ